MIPPSYKKKKGAYESVKSMPSILPCSLLHLPNTEGNEVTKCDLAWAGGVGPLPCRLGQSPFPSQWTSCYSTRPEALWKEALEGESTVTSAPPSPSSPATPEWVSWDPRGGEDGSCPTGYGMSNWAPP